MCVCVCWCGFHTIPGCADRCGFSRLWIYLLHVVLNTAKGITCLIYTILYIYYVCVLMRIPYNSWLCRSVWTLQIVDILAACSWSRKNMLLVIISVCFLRGRCRHVHHAPSDCYVSWPGSLGGGWCDECGALSAGCQITGHSAWAERCSPNVDSVLLHWYPDRPPM